MKRVALLEKDQAIVDKQELVDLLISVRGAVQNASHAFVWFETENHRQQELRDSYCSILSGKADDINKYLLKLGSD